MRCCRPCWIGRLRVNYNNHVVARRWFPVEAISRFKRGLLRNLRSQRHANSVAAGAPQGGDITVPNPRGIGRIVTECFR